MTLLRTRLPVQLSVLSMLKVRVSPPFPLRGGRALCWALTCLALVGPHPLH